MVTKVAGVRPWILRFLSFDCIHNNSLEVAVSNPFAGSPDEDRFLSKEPLRENQTDMRFFKVGVGSYTGTCVTSHGSLAGFR